MDRTGENGTNAERDKAEANKIMDAFTEMLAAHAECRWEQVGMCVWCADHNQRLYIGDLPDEKLPADQREKRDGCQHLAHEMYDDGGGVMREMGEGFYYICADCGFKGWYE